MSNNNSPFPETSSVLGMNLSIQTASGLTTTLKLESSSTLIERVKAMIQFQEHIPSDQQRLLYYGIELKNDGTLSDYGIHQDSTLQLLFADGFQLFIKNVQDNMITVDVEHSDTIETVKSKITDKTGLPSVQQHLIFAGRGLENEQTLSHYNIQNGNTLRLALNVPSSMQVLVKTLTGRIFPLIVRSTDTILELKAKIRDQTGTPTYQHRLLQFGGKQLENHLTLADYNITFGYLIYLVLRLRGSNEISIKTFSGNTHSLTVDVTDLIRDVKTMIQEIEGIPPNQQRLLYVGQELEDNRTISDINMCGQNAIYLALPFGN